VPERALALALEPARHQMDRQRVLVPELALVLEPEQVRHQMDQLD